MKRTRLSLFYLDTRDPLFLVIFGIVALGLALTAATRPTDGSKGPAPPAARPDRHPDGERRGAA